MAVGVADRTLQLVVKEALRIGGWILNEGTSTAGTTTSLTDASRERTPVAQANSVSGTYLWMFSGDGAGQQSEISSYGTLGVFTWIPALTSPGTNTGWVRCSLRPQRIIDAIDEITRAGWRRQALPYVSEAILTNNLIGYQGAMEEWDAGITSASNGFTLAGAGSSIARSTTSFYRTYAAQITAGGGAVATLTRGIPSDLMRLINGKSLTLLGGIAANVAADVVVRITVTSAVGTVTTTNRTGTLAGNRWERLADISTATIAIPDPVDTVDVQVRAVASAVVYADDLGLYGPPLYDYEFPPILIGLNPIILMETAYCNRQFTIPLYYGSDWTIVQQDPLINNARFLHFNRPLPSARHLRIAGYRAPDVQATMASNVEPNPVWLAMAAAVKVMSQETIESRSSTERRFLNLKDDLARLEGSSAGDTLRHTPYVAIEPR